MFKSSRNKITDLAQVFLRPETPVHRQYEALRAYFVDKLPSAEAAKRFGYTPGSFRVLVHKFRQNTDRTFFAAPATGPHHAPKRDALRENVVALRKRNLSIYDISVALEREGHALSPVAVSLVLKEEGFARLPRRPDEERPETVRPITAPVADARELDLASRTLHTQFGGLFLFLPYLIHVDFDAIVKKAGLPGSRMIPAAHAMRALLGLKLWGQARHSHVMADVLDEGLALFAGLNAVPKRSFLTEYSNRIRPAAYPKLMRAWCDAVQGAGLKWGDSFDLDFHAIPFHGGDPLVEKHYVSKRSRSQKGVLAFLAQDAKTRVFCYVNADLRADEHDDAILRFVEFWKARTGRLPGELIFDSKLTTYANLDILNHRDIPFITLRRRSAKMLDAIGAIPRGQWRRIELHGVSRQYRTPRILDQRITLGDYYDGPIRQIVIEDLGHEEPTFLLTNQLRRGAVKLIERYARRMLIENNIQDGVDFFHMDALTSAVALKVNCDLHLTLMGSSLYRLLAQDLGHTHEHAKARHLFADFVRATATVTLGDDTIDVRFQRRRNNPFLLNAGFDKTDVPIPWLGNKRLRFHLD